MRPMFQRYLRTSQLVLGMAVFAACGDEESDEEAIKPPDTTHVDIMVADTDYEVSRFSDLKLPYDTSEGCIAAKTTDWSIRDCLCNKCLEKMQECDVLKGCQEIVSCSLRTGCQDEFTCYLSPLSQCTKTVDDWGNASVATSVSLALMDCAVFNRCR